MRVFVRVSCALSRHVRVAEGQGDQGRGGVGGVLGVACWRHTRVTRRRAVSARGGFSKRDSVSTLLALLWYAYGDGGYNQRGYIARPLYYVLP